MVLVDANVLLYAINIRAPQHARCKRWLEEALGGSEMVGFAWLVLLAFARLATLPAIFSSPLAPPDAFELIDRWLSSNSALIVQPTRRHSAILRDLLIEVGTAGNLVNDAHLAALAIEHGARVCSLDRDFTRFRGLAVEIPA